MSDRIRIPEVIGAPSAQGAILVHAQCSPFEVFPEDEEDEMAHIGKMSALASVAYTVPAHCPVFCRYEHIVAHGDVVKVCAMIESEKLKPDSFRVAGVSIDGLYNGVQQVSGNEGANRFAMAISGLVTLAARHDEVKNFSYGDAIYVHPLKKCVPELLQDTFFSGRMSYTNNESESEPQFRLGTFVCPVDADGGMRVMLDLPPAY